MKIRILIIGIILLVFGLVNIFWYAPHSLTLVFMNQPFPFQHLEGIQVHDGGGFGTSIHHLPFEAVMADPYWLVWSLALYGGIGITAFGLWRSRM